MRTIVSGLRAASALCRLAGSLRRLRRGRAKQNQEEITMKKSTLVAIIAFLSAVVGALGAMFFYLRRREAELDEYEQLLFSEEPVEDDAPAETPDSAEEETEE